MTKKDGGKRDKDADFVVLDEIREPGASLDDLSALNDMFNWSAFDDKFAHLNDWATFDAMFPADLMLDKLDGLFQPIEKPMGKSRLRRVVKRRPCRTGGEPPR